MGFGNVGKMMKQMQKMQEQLAKMQEELAGREIEATSGGGAVRVRVNGRQEVQAVEISPEVLGDGDVEMLQDLILAAVNEALRMSQEMAASEMGKITGGLNIPGLT